MTDDTDLNEIRQRHYDMLAGYTGTLRYTKYAEKDMGALLAEIDRLQTIVDKLDRVDYWAKQLVRTEREMTGVAVDVGALADLRAALAGNAGLDELRRQAEAAEQAKETK